MPIDFVDGGDGVDAGGALDAGDDGDAGEDGGVGEGLAESYCERIVEFFCPFYLRCGRMAVDDLVSCRDVFLESCNAKYEPRYVDLEAAGLLALDLDGVAICEAHLDAVACEAQPMELEGPCSAMWTGTQGDGDACGFDVESFVCGPETTCVLGLDLCGTCHPTAAVGESCGGGTSCEREADCVNGLCVARPEAGEACGDGASCRFGTYCVDGACTGPTFVGLGEACGGLSRCPYKSACVGGVCVESALLGEACTAAGCASGQCVDGTCAPFADDGEACAAGYECASGLCGGGVCAPLPSGCF